MRCSEVFALGLLPICATVCLPDDAPAQHLTARHPNTLTTAIDVTILRQDAAVGDPEAMVRLGIALEYGQGTKTNH
ncbi:MAG: hypothetical protein V3U11_14045, partial [Planctomycetota bacterium]